MNGCQSELYYRMKQYQKVHYKNTSHELINLPIPCKGIDIARGRRNMYYYSRQMHKYLQEKDRKKT